MDTIINNSGSQKRNVASKILITLLVLILIAAGIGITYGWQHQQVDSLNQQVTNLNKDLDTANTLNNATKYTSLKSVTVRVFSPELNGKVSSPLGVVGMVPGNWSSEASFPVKLLNSKAKVVASGTAKVLSDWMTTSLVPFSAQLTWGTLESKVAQPGGDGTLVLYKDNPSGIADNDDSVSIPVKF